MPSRLVQSVILVIVLTVSSLSSGYYRGGLEGEIYQVADDISNSTMEAPNGR